MPESIERQHLDIKGLPTKHRLGPAAATGKKSRNTGTIFLRSERHPGFPDIRPPQTETLFHTYSQFSTVSDIPAKPTEEERTTEAKLQDLLEKRENVISQLSRLLDSEAALTSSALKQNNLALLREKLAEHKRDLVRLRKTISEARDRAHLLTNVRSDIDEYRANNPENAEAEYMLAERSRIDNSHNMADSVLSQAYAVQDSFNIQRETLASINRRITMAASQVPGLNSLISRISAKKRRDGIIMGAFIAFCFLMFWWFL
ncbi:vesicle transport V-SNARE protein [Colletotrichum limetticola]|uniref:Vesicle transport V-SNARE protein n=1 Tax=Colletotrichum limetticola TaxID=1209924 RepID=A0ABQ9Q4A9_9PEZI|nr:vesicle transport V-SNARE protein [Colletotrichum limetticola]